MPSKPNEKPLPIPSKRTKKQNMPGQFDGLHPKSAQRKLQEITEGSQEISREIEYNIYTDLETVNLQERELHTNRIEFPHKPTMRRSDISIGDFQPGRRGRRESISLFDSASTAPMKKNQGKPNSHETEQNKPNDAEMSTNEAPKKTVTFQETKMEKKTEHAEYTNRPHPSLEYPPLYWALKPFPSLLEAVRPMYHFRWSLAHPLQKRVVLSKKLRKMGIFMTWGELLFLLPFVGMLLGGSIYTFIFPSVANTGKFARLALIFAVMTAMRNSLFTLVLGMPFERTLWYHKLAGRIAFVNGILHTVVAYMKPVSGLAYESFSLAVLQEFLLGNVINASGTLLAMLISGVVLTSLPYVRRKCFEIFYYTHVVFVAIMAICALYHSGVLVPTLVALTWGVDIFFRKFVMANCKYSTKGTIKVISETVIEISFPKKSFDYNPGQHLSIAVPDISLFEWHPFSISTCPRQKHVSVHIRKAGNWTTALYDLARSRKGNEIDILVEGPNGSPEIDFLSDGPNNRYKSVLLISGGIGITPIQSICNQLVYEHSKGLRDINRIRLVWTERDPVLMQGLDIVQSTSKHFTPLDVELGSVYSGSSGWRDARDDFSISTAGIATTLLSMMPPSHRTDAEIEMDYPTDYFDESTPFDTADHAIEAVLTEPPAPKTVDHHSVDESTFQAAFNFDNNAGMADIFDLQVYITSKGASDNPALTNLPFVHSHRPDLKKIFADMRDEAIANGTKDVAVIVCAPARLAHICKKACVKYSNSQVHFGFHMEYQD